MEDGALSKPAAVVACAAMASFYVGILYSPTLILRLPPPSSHTNFLIRRFICTGISSVVSIVACALLLPIKSGEASQLLGVYGIRIDHSWQAVVFPLSLTALMYAGSLTFMSVLLILSVRHDISHSGGLSVGYVKNILREVAAYLRSIASSVMLWRIYVVAPVTEELVFRACMIPLLLCAGFQKNTVIFLCPIFFSLAHLNHLMDVHIKQQNNWTKACMIIGLQLGYTVVFGSYASFLFIRTGHFLAPVVAHMFCNIMGLPLLVSPGKGIITLAFIVGALGFMWLLFPITNPGLYNDRTDNCRCWQGFCSVN